MINAHTLLARSWIRHEQRGIQRFITLLPRYKDDQLPIPAYYLGDEPYEWLINGCTEDEWSGIPLTPDILTRSGFTIANDNEWIRSYRTENNFYVTWIVHKGGPYGEIGDIIVADERKIEFVHELQLMYFATCKKLLNINL